MANQSDPIKESMTLASNLKKKLKELGITTSKLAKDTGVPPTTVFNWINGQAPKNIKQVRAIANYLQVSIEELVFSDAPTIRSRSPLEEYINDELYAGKFEVVLRRIAK